jgi:hypothetical protein
MTYSGGGVPKLPRGCWIDDRSQLYRYAKRGMHRPAVIPRCRNQLTSLNSQADYSVMPRRSGTVVCAHVGGAAQQDKQPCASGVTHLREMSTPASCSATTVSGSSDFFMWLHAWNCWLMQMRNRKADRKAPAKGDIHGEATRNKPAGYAAG